MKRLKLILFCVFFLVSFADSQGLELKRYELGVNLFSYRQFSETYDDHDFHKGIFPGFLIQLNGKKISVKAEFMYSKSAKNDIFSGYEYSLGISKYISLPKGFYFKPGVDFFISPVWVDKDYWYGTMLNAGIYKSMNSRIMIGFDLSAIFTFGEFHHLPYMFLKSYAVPRGVYFKYLF